MPFPARPPETAESRAARARAARRGVRAGGMPRGHCLGPTANPASGRVHMPGSIQAQLARGEDLSDGIRPGNLRYQKIAGRGRRNLLFLIDTSGSMLSDDRFARVKGCVISLLEGSYAKRVRVAVISYGGGGARLELPFTASAELAAGRIGTLRGGGSTPLVEALGVAGSLLERMAGENLSVWLFSDCRYNRSGSGRENLQVREFGAFCRARGIPITLIDASLPGKTARGRAALFAAELQARHERLEDLRAETFLSDEAGAETAHAPAP